MTNTSHDVPTPDPMASFREVDRWLLARGWEYEGGAWKFRGARRVTIATHQEASKLQRRWDKAAPTPDVTKGEPTP